MTVANPARCREKRLCYQRAVNRRFFSLHGRSFTVSPAVSRPVWRSKMQRSNLKLVKGDHGAPGTFFAGFPPHPGWLNSAITALISKTDEGLSDLKDYFCLDDQEGSIKGWRVCIVYFWCYCDVLPFFRDLKPSWRVILVVEYGCIASCWRILLRWMMHRVLSVSVYILHIVV